MYVCTYNACLQSTKRLPCYATRVDTCLPQMSASFQNPSLSRLRADGRHKYKYTSLVLDMSPARGSTSIRNEVESQWLCIHRHVELHRSHWPDPCCSGDDLKTSDMSRDSHVLPASDMRITEMQGEEPCWRHCVVNSFLDHASEARESPEICFSIAGPAIGGETS
jgi:hypothetical protein